jgi:hypothetical protein
MHNKWALRKLQFRTLYRVFFLRLVDLDLLSADADLATLIGQFAVIFCTFSFVISIPLMLMNGATLVMTNAWMFEHFLIETTMTVAGLIVVLNWDAAFPDKRDLLVLAPLPVRKSMLFLAKVSALFAAPALAVVALNSFSGLLWPLLFRSDNSGFVGMLRALPAYWFTIFAAGGFLTLTILTLQGLAANLLPRQLFLRLSAVLQAAIMCILVSVYLLEPSLESPEALTSPQNQRLLEWLPSYWFLALFNQLNGSMHPALAPLAARAWAGLAVSIAGTCTALFLCYFRLMPQIVEQPDILPRARFASWSRRFGSPLTEALTLFSLRTLLRSRQHRMIFSFYLGIGITIIIGYVNTTPAGLRSAKGTISNSLLFASILMMILTVAALRVVASIPISLPANWIIRITQVRAARDYQKSVRFSWLTLAVTPVLLVVIAFVLVIYPWRNAIEHFGMMLCLGILLVELCLFTFPKIPFTCSYLPGKAQIHFVFWAGMLIFLRLLTEAARFEERLLNRPLSCLMAILGITSAALGIRYLSASRAAATEEMLFEEKDPAQITTLKLS